MPEPNEKPTIDAKEENALVLEQPTREISQTDHINKKLLTSLFKRMDEEDTDANKVLEADNNAEDDDEWKD